MSVVSGWMLSVGLWVCYPWPQSCLWFSVHLNVWLCWNLVSYAVFLNYGPPSLTHTHTHTHTHIHTYTHTHIHTHSHSHTHSSHRMLLQWPLPYMQARVNFATQHKVGQNISTVVSQFYYSFIESDSYTPLVNHVHSSHIEILSFIQRWLLFRECFVQYW